MTFSDWVQKWINQIAHVGWGAFLLLAINLNVPLKWAVLAVAAFATIKEFIFDKLTETPAEQGSDLQDWAFWWAGIILGVLVSVLS
jgi:hypothetical protein